MRCYYLVKVEDLVRDMLEESYFSIHKRNLDYDGLIDYEQNEVRTAIDTLDSNQSYCILKFGDNFSPSMKGYTISTEAEMLTILTDVKWSHIINQD